MKIGSAIAFLLLALIALGYLLSDNINMHGELSQARQQNAQLTREKNAIQAKLDLANASLVEGQRMVSELTQKNLAQREQIQKLSEENTNLKEQNASLQNQSKVLSLFKPTQRSLSKALSLAIFLPIFPVSLAATYIIVRYNKNRAQRKTGNAKARRETSVQLTDEEVKEIIRIRRAK